MIIVREFPTGQLQFVARVHGVNILQQLWATERMLDGRPIAQDLQWRDVPLVVAKEEPEQE